MRLPQDLALVVRVTTVLEGVCRTLDPDFDFIDIITEYVMEQGAADAGTAIRDEIRGTVTNTGRALVRTPPEIEGVLDRARREELLLQALLRDSNGVATRLAKRLLLGLLVSGSLPVAAFFYTRGNLVGVSATAGLIALAGGLLVWSFRRQRRLQLSSPQFTRYELRQRQQSDAGD
jgi:predicted unusual protein kinase regulating ubiquinone biosynthesis (AarF/ABC1/UbiB family)